MTDREKIKAIKAEIERLKYIQFAPILLCEDLVTFIDSLPEEQTSEDLEEAAEEYAGVNYDCETETDAFYHYIGIEGFKAGAEWQKDQMIDKACEWLRRTQPQVILPDTTIERFREAMEGK